MIEAIVAALGGWTWWLLGLLLLAVEVAAPGFFFLWFGIAAILIGTGTLLFAWPWQAQILGFAVLSVVAALVGRRLMGGRRPDDDEPQLNQRAQRLTGRVFVLAEPIAGGAGRVRVDDTVWRVSGPDLPVGTRVRIAGASGTTLQVEPAAAPDG